jgi:hypothetical protein
VAAVLTAAVGAWVLWSVFSQLSTVSWWYDRAQRVQDQAVLPNPTYDLNSLPWTVVHPRVFDVTPRGATLVSDAEPYGYQVLAVVATKGADAVDIQFDVDILSGGVTIGVQQAGKWITSNSSQRLGRFSESNTAPLGYRRSLTVVIANNNPLGETRLAIKSLRLYLRE